MCFSPDESLLATCGSDGIRLWNPRTAQFIKHLAAHSGDVNWVNFSPDGKLFATSSDDKTVKIWETGNWTVQRTLQFQNYAVGAAFSPDGRRFVVAERGVEQRQNRITLFTTENWEQERSWQAHHAKIQGLDFSPDSKL